MMLKVYSAALVVCEVPTIIRLLKGDALSVVSAWFLPGVNDTPEMGAVYAAWLVALCISRTLVISFPKSRGVLFHATAIHALEIPLYGYLMTRLPSAGPLQFALMAAILINPFFFLRAALKNKA